MNHKITLVHNGARTWFRWCCSCGRTSKKSWGMPGHAEAAGGRHVLDAHPTGAEGGPS